MDLPSSESPIRGGDGRLLLALELAVWLLWLEIASVGAATDASDVQALGVLYNSLNLAPQLLGWKASGGDPCTELWQGVTCSGSAVISLQLSGLGLNGSLGYLLSGLQSLKTLDLSNNNIHEAIPYQLPPNLTNMNFASNQMFGNLPYSISSMTSLTYLNVSHNMLFEPIGDIFANLQDLSVLDLSFNKLGGILPNSVGSLSNLSSLYLQENELSGSVNVLANLDLNYLDISNNHFTGWVPSEFKSIPNLRVEGNSFQDGQGPPLPSYVSSPKAHNHSHRHTHRLWGAEQTFHPYHKRKGFGTFILTGIICGCILFVLCALLAAILCFKKKSSKEPVQGSSKCIDGDATITKNEDDWHQISDYMSSYAPTEWSLRTKEHFPSNTQPCSSHVDEVLINKVIEERTKSVSSMMTPKPPSLEKASRAKVSWRNGLVNTARVPVNASPYSVSSLQLATNSFGQEFLVGEGSLGRVYRAEFSNGKVVAIKKIDCAALSMQEDDFLEAVSTMSRFRHPNIIALLGYCIEHGQRLLLYEYIRNGTLHDLLHFTDDNSKVLSWNSRIKIALGTARALEYLHEVCWPPVIHKNIKSANILLDEEFIPHLSDCGLAMLTPNAERQVLTEIVGSFGYSAPEFAMSGIYTIKSDVYSLGVLMLELLTGRKPLDCSRDRSEQSLVKWATPQLHDIDALARMVDASLNGMYPAKSLSRFADIISLCVQSEPEFRPPVSVVVQSLVQLAQRTNLPRRLTGDDFTLLQMSLEMDSAICTRL